MMRSMFRTAPPLTAVEIGTRHVAAVSIAGAPGGFRIAGYAVEPLPEGAVVPSLTATNLTQPEAVADAVTRAFGRLGARPRRVGLVVPDAVAKVSLVRFARVPARAADFEELVRFQVRKAVPFKPEDAQITWAPGAAVDGGREYVVVQARRDIVQEYERACAAAGASAGLVDLATFNVINAVLAVPPPAPGDWLLVHMTPDSSTIAIMREADLIFYRNRGADGDDHLSDLVHQTAMYYQDRLGGGGFARVLLAGSAGAATADDARRSIEARLRVPVESVDPVQAVPLADRVSPSRDLVTSLTPALGLALAHHARV